MLKEERGGEWKGRWRVSDEVEFVSYHLAIALRAL